MENGLLYVLAFSAMAIALLASILPQAPLYSEISGIPNTVNPATYTVSQVGSTTKATHYNGTIMYSSTNFSYVLNTLVNELGDGGKIFIRQGLYSIDTPIRVPAASENLEIVGETIGWQPTTSGTRIVAAASFPTGSADYILYVQAGFFTLRDLAIDGNYTAKGVLLGAWDIKMQDCSIRACTYGVAITAANIWLTRNWIEYCTTYGVYLSSWVEYVWIEQCMFYNNGNMDIAGNPAGNTARNVAWIKNNRFYNSIRGIDVWGVTNTLMVTGNSFYNQTYCVRLEGNLTWLQFNDNCIEGNSVTASALRIENAVTLDSLTMVGNRFNGLTGGWLSLGGSGTITNQTNVSLNYGGGL